MIYIYIGMAYIVKAYIIVADELAAAAARRQKRTGAVV